MVVSRVGLAAVLLFAASPLLAKKAQPSFDCAKAATPVEKLVCAEPSLAWLDRFMAGVYSRAVASMPEAGKIALKGDQRAWVKERERECTSGGREAQVDCVATSYRQQIVTLAPQVEGQASDKPEGRWHYFREGLVGEAAISKSSDGTYAIRGDTVAGNRTAHTCGIELGRGQLQANVLSWADEISECRVTMTLMGDAAIVKYKCVGGSNPNCGVAAAWDGTWVRAPQ